MLGGVCSTGNACESLNIMRLLRKSGSWYTMFKMVKVDYFSLKWSLGVLDLVCIV